MKTFIYWLKDAKNDVWIDLFSDAIRTLICSWAKHKPVTFFSFESHVEITVCKRCGMRCK